MQEAFQLLLEGADRSHGQQRATATHARLNKCHPFSALDARGRSVVIELDKREADVVHGQVVKVAECRRLKAKLEKTALSR